MYFWLDHETGPVYCSRIRRLPGADQAPLPSLLLALGHLPSPDCSGFAAPPWMQTASLPTLRFFYGVSRSRSGRSNVRPRPQALMAGMLSCVPPPAAAATHLGPVRLHTCVLLGVKSLT